jgi:lysophospholipase L1-like esterase
MDRVDVKVIPMAAGGMPLGRVDGAAHLPIAMCDQKTALNYLCGIYGNADCLIIFGGANDWLYGSPTDLKNNVTIGAVEVGYFAHQISIPKIIFVSPIIARFAATDELLQSVRDGILDAVNFLTLNGVDCYYINGVNLLPNVAENYVQDGLHPTDLGTQIMVDNLIDELQTLGIFPADYV